MNFLRIFLIKEIGRKATVKYDDDGRVDRREFSIVIGVTDPRKVRTVVENSEENSKVVMLTFFPKIETEDDILTEISMLFFTEISLKFL